MRWTRRLSFIVPTATAVAAVLGFAAPAHASYTNEPLTLAWNPVGAVHSSVSSNGVVYLGGKLDGTGGIAAVDAATSTLLWQVPADNDVRALALSPDGSTLYAGGNFTAVDGVTHRHLVAINVADHSLMASWKGRAGGAVRDLVVRDNTVYVAGKITTVDGVAQRGMGAVDATTGLRDATFAFSADNDVLGMATTGSLLVISGSFAHINGVTRSKLASIDLSTNTLTSFAPASLCSGCDQYWDVQTDGAWAYVGTSGAGGNFGAFNLATGQQRWRYLHADGDVQAVWLPGDGKAYLGGHFGQTIYTTGSPQTAVAVTVMAAVDLTTGLADPTFTPKIYHTYPGCWTFTSTDGKLWAGGDFTGEAQDGRNNLKPYLTAYAGI